MNTAKGLKSELSVCWTRRSRVCSCLSRLYSCLSRVLLFEGRTPFFSEARNIQVASVVLAIILLSAIIVRYRTGLAFDLRNVFCHFVEHDSYRDCFCLSYFFPSRQAQNHHQSPQSSSHLSSKTWTPPPSPPLLALPPSPPREKNEEERD